MPFHSFSLRLSFLWLMQSLYWKSLQHLIFDSTSCIVFLSCNMYLFGRVFLNLLNPVPCRHETQRLKSLSKRGSWREALQVLPELLLCSVHFFHWYIGVVFHFDPRNGLLEWFISASEVVSRRETGFDLPPTGLCLRPWWGFQTVWWVGPSKLGQLWGRNVFLA